MADQALRDNHILSRFSSVNEMARWLSDLLGWEVVPKHLRTYITRFRARDNNKEEDQRYLDFRDLYYEQSLIYHEIMKKKMEEIILTTKDYK